MFTEIKTSDSIEGVISFGALKCICVHSNSFIPAVVELDTSEVEKPQGN
jgi:hypothetical protein